MADEVEVWERWGSPILSNDNATLKYGVSGTDGEATAVEAMLDFAPEFYGGYVRDAWNIEPFTPDSWVGEVTYKPSEKKDREPPVVGSYTWDFDTTGATVNLKAAKEHIASYPNPTASGYENPHKGAIGVSRDGEPAGADIVIPALKYNFRFRHPEGVVTIAYSRLLSQITGSTNLNPFLGFPAGELLYIGSTGSDGSQAEAEISYSIVASVNASGLTIGGIADIVKQGHHYLWVEFKDEVEGDSAVTQPKRVHIERVYDAVDFASVFGWGGET